MNILKSGTDVAAGLSYALQAQCQTLGDQLSDAPASTNLCSITHLLNVVESHNEMFTCYGKLLHAEAGRLVRIGEKLSELDSSIKAMM